MHGGLGNPQSMRVPEHGQKNSLLISLLLGNCCFLFVAYWVMARHPVGDSLEFAHPLFGRAQRVGLAEEFDAIHRCGIALQLAATRKDRLLQRSAAPLEAAQLI